LIATRADVVRIERTPLAEAVRGGRHITAASRRRAARARRWCSCRKAAPTSRRSPTYDALFRRVTAASLFHRLGVGPCDVVAYVLPSLPQTHYTVGRRGRGHRLHRSIRCSSRATSSRSCAPQASKCW
jgi:fatty-acyl-CoA synthase